MIVQIHRRSIGRNHYEKGCRVTTLYPNSQHCSPNLAMSHPKLSYAAGTPTKRSALKGPATKDPATKGSVYKRSCDQRSATVLVPLVSLPSTSGSLWQAGCLPYIM